jgi:F0F1-type ATP synthase membrane subunit b/b'
MINIFFPIAIVAILVFIMMNYAAQKRRDKVDERRERIKEQMEEIVSSIKDKEAQ